MSEITNKNAIVLRALAEASTLIESIYRPIGLVTGFRESETGKHIQQALRLLESEKPVFAETPAGLGRYTESLWFTAEIVGRFITSDYAGNTEITESGYTELISLLDNGQLIETCQKWVVEFETLYAGSDTTHPDVLESFLLAKINTLCL